MVIDLPWSVCVEEADIATEIGGAEVEQEDANATASNATRLAKLLRIGLGFSSAFACNVFTVALLRRALPLGLSLQFEMCISWRTFKSAQFPDAQHYHHQVTVPGSTEGISLLETRIVRASHLGRLAPARRLRLPETEKAAARAASI